MVTTFLFLNFIKTVNFFVKKRTWQKRQKLLEQRHAALIVVETIIEKKDKQDIELMHESWLQIEVFSVADNLFLVPKFV